MFLIFQNTVLVVNFGNYDSACPPKVVKLYIIAFKVSYYLWQNDSKFSNETETSLNLEKIDSWHFDHRLPYSWSNISRAQPKAPPRCGSPRHRSSPGTRKQNNRGAVGNKPTVAQTNVVLFLVNSGAIGNALSPISRMTSLLFSPHVVVPFYFFGSRKNSRVASALDPLKCRYAERPRTS